MTLRVEQRAVAEHMPLWASLLQQTRDTPPTPASLEWRYLANPHGQARAWVLVDDVSGEVGGYTVVMPRTMMRRGQTFAGWIGADFSILPKFRALGPALQLRRAAREAIDRGEADLLLSFPNLRMTLIHDRAGHGKLGELTRVARPVSLKPYLARAAPGPVAAAIAAPVDVARRLSLRVRTRAANVSVSECVPAAIDARFDRLATHAGHGDRLVGLRDSAYLRWRYLEQPEWRGRVFVAERSGAPAGFLVCSARDNVMFIEDLLSLDDETTSGLVGAAADAAASAGCISVSFTCLQSGAMLPTMQGLGFHERPEEYAVYAYVPERHAGAISAVKPDDWYVTTGDRDV